MGREGKITHRTALLLFFLVVARVVLGVILRPLLGEEERLALLFVAPNRMKLCQPTARRERVWKEEGKKRRRKWKTHLLHIPGVHARLEPVLETFLLLVGLEGDTPVVLFSPFVVAKQASGGREGAERGCEREGEREVGRRKEGQPSPTTVQNEDDLYERDKRANAR